MAEREKLTKAGYDAKAARLKQLRDVDRPAILASVNAAREQGDLSENADYDAARQKQREIEAEIDALQYTLDHAEVIDDVVGNEDVAQLGGGNVTVKNLETGKIYSFLIVGSSEAKPLAKISNESPVALAVAQHKAGDIVEVQVDKPYKLEILKVGD